MRKHFLPFVIIIATSLLALRLSFDLSLFGDDWLQLYIFKFQVIHSKFWGIPIPDLRSLLSPYGPTYYLMGTIHKFFGLNPQPYFIASFIFRCIAGILLYVLVFRLSKSRLAAFATGIFWAVSEIGIESTNWVFNMNSYMGLSLFLLALIFYFKYKEISKVSSLVVTIICLALAAISVPVRMHGGFVTFIGIEVFFLITQWHTKRNIKMFIFLNIIWVSIFAILYKWGVFGSSNFDIYIGNGQRENFAAIQSGKINHLLTPFTTIGNLLFTDYYMDHHQLPRIIFKIHSLSWMRSFLIPLWIVIATTLSTVGFFIVQNKNKLFVILVSVLTLTFAVLINFITLEGVGDSTSPNLVFLTMIGGSLIIFMSLLILFTKPGNIRTGFFLSLVWLLSFAAVPILFTPFNYTPTSMRYLIMPGVAIPLFIGFMVSLPKSMIQKIVLITLIVPFYLIQYTSTQLYFRNLLESRSETISKDVWETILATVPKMDPSKDYLFYFDYANGKYIIVRDVIAFGFIPRMMFYEKSPNRPGGIYIVDREREFVSAIFGNGEEMKRFNWGLPKKFNVDEVFAFRLEQNNQLKDIKDGILKNQKKR